MSPRRRDLRWVARSRAGRQRLATARHGSVLDCVRWSGAVQSQDFSLACWSVAQRTRAATAAEVDAALSAGHIIRTHLLRPTWHFVAADDVRWMLALSAESVRAKLQAYTIERELTPVAVRRGIDALVRLFADGGARTREQVRTALQKTGSKGLSAFSVGHLLMHAELDGLVCSGPPAGSKQTYAAFDSRVPAAPSMMREESLAALAVRYFTSHAPATMRDFRWWSGLSAADAKRAVAGAPNLRARQIDGLDFIDVDDEAGEDTVSSDAHLLQPFDELMVGYTESRHAVDARGLVRDRKLDALLSRTVLLDGQVVGRWSRERSKAGLHVAIVADTADARAKRALEAAAQRYAAFVGQPLVGLTLAAL